MIYYRAVLPEQKRRGKMKKSKKSEKKNNRTPEFFNTLSTVLLACFLLGLLLLVIWFWLFTMLGNWGFDIHAAWFNISRSNFNLLNYYGMATLKLQITVFFLIPFLAIKMIVRRK
jgi:hypothetical protein